MDLIGDPGNTELGFGLVLLGTFLLVAVFAIQTLILSRRLRQREARHKRLEELAFMDPLTRLPNRRLLLDRLQRSLFSAERDQNVVALYFVDLDSFKSINDRFGHDTGDRVLAALADRWTKSLRAVDTVARWGGDEFVIVTEDIESAADIRKVVARLRSATAEPFETGNGSIVLALSIGVAVGSSGSEDPHDLIQCADAAMYRAKRSGEAPNYEVVGQRSTIERLAGFSVGSSESTNQEPGYVRVRSS